MYTFIESYGRTKVVGRVVIETAIIMGIKFNNYLIKTIQTVIILHACFYGEAAASKCAIISKTRRYLDFFTSQSTFRLSTGIIWSKFLKMNSNNNVHLI